MLWTYGFGMTRPKQTLLSQPSPSVCARYGSRADQRSKRSFLETRAPPPPIWSTRLCDRQCLTCPTCPMTAGAHHHRTTVGAHHTVGQRIALRQMSTPWLWWGDDYHFVELKPLRAQATCWRQCWVTPPHGLMSMTQCGHTRHHKRLQMRTLAR